MALKNRKLDTMDYRDLIVTPLYAIEDWESCLYNI
jgi:hypothetical protein